MKVVCYAQPDKTKSKRVMDAFCAGCGGRMAWTTEKALLDGDCAFYGVRPPWKHLYEQAKREGRRIYYLDNSYFDVAREKEFRVGVNSLQSWQKKPSDGRRLARLGVQVLPWRQTGDYILLTPQTDEFMATLHGISGWTDQVIASLQASGNYRDLVVRRKGARAPLQRDLKKAWALIAYSSAAAVEALIAGVPVIVQDETCAAYDFSGLLEDIESPMMPNGRLEWLGRLADSQFSLDEMKDGKMWRALNEW